MSRIRVSTVIDAPPRAVWAGVRDISTHVTWMADAEAIRFLSRQREGVGTRFECDTVVGPFRLVDRMTVTEWRPGKAMGIEHVGVVTGTGVFTLRRTPRGRTRFTWTESLTFPWWMAGPLGAFLAKPVLAAVWRGNLRRLKARIEGTTNAVHPVL